MKYLTDAFAKIKELEEKVASSFTSDISKLKADFEALKSRVAALEAKIKEKV